MIRAKNVALAAARKHFGDRAFAEDKGGSSSPEARAWAQAERQRYPKPVAPDIRDRDAWPEDATVGAFRATRDRYVREFSAWKKRDDTLFSQAMRYRYWIGAGHVVSGMGDTWDEALAKAIARQ